MNKWTWIEYEIGKEVNKKIVRAAQLREVHPLPSASPISTNRSLECPDENPGQSNQKTDKRFEVLFSVLLHMMMQSLSFPPLPEPEVDIESGASR